MTAIVGVFCDDGIVVGSDSSATFSCGTTRTIEQPCRKIDIIADRIIVAGTGAAGLHQRFCDIVEQQHAAGMFDTPAYLQVGTALCAAAIHNFASTQVQQGQYGVLLGYAYDDASYLCEFDLATFQPEWKTANIWYVSMGSGQPITDPFLGFMRRVFWQQGVPHVSDATFAVAWTLHHVIELNPGGINAPLQVAILSKDSDSQQYQAKMLSDDELQQHMNNITGAEDHLAQYQIQPALPGDIGAEGADVPQPPEV